MDTKKPGDGAKKEKHSANERVTILLPRELSERAKNAIFYTPANVTLKMLATLGVEHGVKILERKYNNKKPFPQRTAELIGGRPVK